MNKDLYRPIGAIAALLRAGRQRARQRVSAADMIALAEAASLMAVDEPTVAGWVRCGRCIALEVGRTMRLPRWQFDPLVWPAIQRISESLGGTIDGWQILDFLETSAPALDGLTPRAALEQGVPIRRVLDVAVAAAH